MIWSILGISVAVLAVFSVTLAETLVGIPLFEAYRPHAAVGLGVVGAIAWFIGRTLASRRRSDSKSFLLFDLRYWGPVLVAFGVITLFIRPLRHEKPAKPTPVAQPKPRPAAPVVAQKPVEPAPEPAKPAVFPPLKMQGVIFKESKPVAIINGQSYSVGDSLGGEVLVRAIQRDSVMLELAGEMKVLTVY